MRTAFIEQLTIEARTNPSIFLLVGDLGYSVIEGFANEFPDRYLNAGVAEQNMTGVAAGLASEGYHVFTYSIANFPTLRCLEQIRNDVCYHKLPVTVVSVGAGLSYGSLGYSHHAVQDIAIMRTLPGITVLSPSDPVESRECVKWLSKNPGPSYLRIGKAGEPVLRTTSTIDDSPVLINEKFCEIAIVATGSILKEAIDASNKLGVIGIEVSVYSVTFLKPITSNISKLSRHKHVLTIEEHVSEGGLGSLIREYINTNIISLSLNSDNIDQVGSQETLKKLNGLTSENIISIVKNLLKLNNSNSH